MSNNGDESNKDNAQVERKFENVPRSNGHGHVSRGATRGVSRGGFRKRGGRPGPYPKPQYQPKQQQQQPPALPKHPQPPKPKGNKKQVPPFVGPVNIPRIFKNNCVIETCNCHLGGEHMEMQTSPQALQVRKLEETIAMIFGDAWSLDLAPLLKHWSSLMHKSLKMGLNNVDWNRVQSIIRGLDEERKSTTSSNPEAMEQGSTSAEELKKKLD